MNTDTVNEHEHDTRTRVNHNLRRDNGVLSRKTESVIKSVGYRNPVNKTQETPGTVPRNLDHRRNVSDQGEVDASPLIWYCLRAMGL